MELYRYVEMIERVRPKEARQGSVRKVKPLNPSQQYSP